MKVATVLRVNIIRVAIVLRVSIMTATALEAIKDIELQRILKEEPINSIKLIVKLYCLMLYAYLLILDVNKQSES